MSSAPRETARIRKATTDDAVAMAALLGQLGYATTPEEVIGRLDRMVTEPGQHVLVAEIDRTVVGLANVFIRHLLSADAPIARLASIVVDDTRRSQGIGHQLVAAAEEIARESRCDRVELTSGDQRPRAHDFYRRLGYEERSRRFIKNL